MTDWPSFLFAVLALLATPGPTNTLMAAAGARVGAVRALPLVVGELGGYIVAIALWAEVLGVLAADHPWFPLLAKLIAAAYLVWSAVKLWLASDPAETAQHDISLGRVFTTTLLNPKALVFAFAVFPPLGIVERLPYVLLFGALVAATAAAWAWIGMLAARSVGKGATRARIDRFTAVVLAVFASVLVVQSVAAMPM